MLTIGVWIIATILLIAFWDKVIRVIIGFFGIAVAILIGIALLGCAIFGAYWLFRGVSWLAHHKIETALFLFSSGLFAFCISGLFSIPHLIVQSYKTGWRRSFIVVFPGLWGKALIALVVGGYCAYCVNVVYRYREALAIHRATPVTIAILRNDKVGEAVMMLIPVLLILSLYAHRRLCIANMISCWITRPFRRRNDTEKIT